MLADGPQFGGHDGEALQVQLPDGTAETGDRPSAGGDGARVDGLCLTGMATSMPRSSRCGRLPASLRQQFQIAKRTETSSIG